MADSKKKVTHDASPNDVALWGEKDTSGAYPPGTKFELADGSKVDVNKVPDVLGGKGAKRPAKRPAKRSR